MKVTLSWSKDDESPTQEKEFEIPEDVVDTIFQEYCIDGDITAFQDEIEALVKPENDPKKYLRYSMVCDWLYYACQNCELPECLENEGIYEGSCIDASFHFLDLARKDESYHINDIIAAGARMNLLSKEGGGDVYDY